MTADNGQPFKYGFDSASGKYGYWVESGGADTFVPFSSNPYQNLTGKYFKRDGATNTVDDIPNGTAIVGGDYMTLVFPHKTMTQTSNSPYGLITCARADGTIEYLSGYGPHTVYLGDVLSVYQGVQCSLSWAD